MKGQYYQNGIELLNVKTAELHQRVKEISTYDEELYPYKVTYNCYCDINSLLQDIDAGVHMIALMFDVQGKEVRDDMLDFDFVASIEEMFCDFTNRREVYRPHSELDEAFVKYMRNKVYDQYIVLT